MVVVTRVEVEPAVVVGPAVVVAGVAPGEGGRRKSRRSPGSVAGAGGAGAGVGGGAMVLGGIVIGATVVVDASKAVLGRE